MDLPKGIRTLRIRALNITSLSETTDVGPCKALLLQKNSTLDMLEIWNRTIRFEWLR